MKKWTILIAVVLAMVLVFLSAIPALAAGTGSRHQWRGDRNCPITYMWGQ